MRSPTRRGARTALAVCLLLPTALATPPGPAAAQAASSAPLPQSAPQHAAQDTGDAPLLVAGTPVERELSGGQTHIYRVRLEAGQYVYAVVEQKSIYVVSTLFGPDHARLVEVDSPYGLEPIAFVAERGGDYQLEVRPLDEGAAPGHYEARIEQAHAATQRD